MVSKGVVKTVDTVYCRKSEQTEESAMKSLFEELGRSYHRRVNISCLICSCLKVFLLVSGASDGSTT